MVLSLSEAINISRIPDSDFFEITNLISGKSFKVDELTLNVLCVKKSDKVAIHKELTKIGYSSDDANRFIDQMIHSNILQSVRLDEIIEFSHYIHPLFGLNQMDIYKIFNPSICIIGLPFGNGNLVDSRCKHFPRHLRNFTNSIFGNKSIIPYIDTFNFKSISDNLDINNLRKLLSNNRIFDCGDLIYTTGENNNIYYNKIQNLYHLQIFSKKLIPLSIGGDHSITYPILQALDKENKFFDIVQFDAHSDFRRSKIINYYQKFGILNHSNVMNYCIQLKNVSNLFQVGVREPFIVSDTKIKQISIYELRNQSIQWRELIKSPYPIYISIDVDFFDPSVVFGTANPLPNGLFYEEAILYLKELLRSKQILGIDIVEANHELDSTNMTTHIVKNIILFILSILNLDE